MSLKLKMACKFLLIIFSTTFGTCHALTIQEEPLAFFRSKTIAMGPCCTELGHSSQVAENFYSQAPKQILEEAALKIQKFIATGKRFSIALGTSAYHKFTHDHSQLHNLKASPENSALPKYCTTIAHPEQVFLWDKKGCAIPYDEQPSSQKYGLFSVHCIPLEPEHHIIWIDSCNPSDFPYAINCFHFESSLSQSDQDL